MATILVEFCALEQFEDEENTDASFIYMMGRTSPNGQDPRDGKDGKISAL
jgi:hypothetical protein